MAATTKPMKKVATATKKVTEGATKVTQVAKPRPRDYVKANDWQIERGIELVLIEGFTRAEAAWAVKMKESALTKQIQQVSRVSSDDPPKKPSPMAVAVAHRISATIANNIERVLFFPDDASLLSLFYMLESVRSTMDIVMFIISSREIVHYLKLAHERHVVIRIICDRSQLGTRDSRAHELAAVGIPVRQSIGGSMHEKFCIIDDELVLSGSINWSERGTETNYEDLGVRKGGRVPSDFVARFDRLHDIRSQPWEPPLIVEETPEEQVERLERNVKKKMFEKEF